jgi:hypothetical protein
MLHSRCTPELPVSARADAGTRTQLFLDRGSIDGGIRMDGGREARLPVWLPRTLGDAARCR